MNIELRDYFAGQVLAGMLSRTFTTISNYEEAASGAYAMADAMIKAREQK